MTETISPADQITQIMETNTPILAECAPASTPVRNDLLTEEMKRQERLLNIAINHPEIAKKVLEHAEQFHPFYNNVLAAFKEGLGATRHNFKSYLERLKLKPVEIAAQMSIYQRIEIKVEKLNNAAGLFEFMNQYAEANKKDILIKRFKAGDHSTHLLNQLEGMGIEVSKLRGAVICERLQDETYEADEIGNAQLFADAFSNDIRYVSEWKKWLQWEGKRWVPINTETVQLLGQDLVRHVMPLLAINIKDPDRRAKYFKHIAATTAIYKVNAMIEGARGRMVISVAKLDANPDLFNLQNGTLDCRTGEVHSHRREDFNTKLSPCSHVPGATAPTWETFLNRIFTNGVVNSEMIQYLRIAMGYTLTGSVTEQCMMVLYGNGANGKSTFLETFLHLLGDYGKPIQPSVLLSLKRDSGNGEDVAGLFGVRLAVAVETREGGAFNEEKVKALTGGDMVTARRLYENSFAFTPTHKIWLATNHKPHVKGSDDGIWRRLKLIPFLAKITDAEKDTDLARKLREEADGIFLWCLQGLKQWNTDGLHTPTDVVAATTAYREESDIFGQFLSDICQIGPTESVQSSLLYNAYTNWAKDNGIEYRMTSVTMAKKLQERGIIKVSKSSGNFWKGIGLAAF